MATVWDEVHYLRTMRLGMERNDYADNRLGMERI